MAGVSEEEARRLFPERPLAEIKDDGATYRGHWTRWTGKGPLQDRLFYAVSPESTVTWEFSGSDVTLIHKVGPDCGIAEILIDGQPAKVRELETYGREVQWNHRTVLASGVTPGNHVVHCPAVWTRVRQRPLTRALRTEIMKLLTLLLKEQI